MRRVPLNRLVNEAVGEYLMSRTARLEGDLEMILDRVRAYRAEDADFEAAIARFAEDEAVAAGSDPVEGDTIHPVGSAQRLVHDLIRG